MCDDQRKTPHTFLLCFVRYFHDFELHENVFRYMFCCVDKIWLVYIKM